MNNGRNFVLRYTRLVISYDFNIMHLPLNVITGLCLLTNGARAAYVWPSPHDHIEDLLFLQSGYIRFGSLSDREF